jgi:hypothetical protein
MHGVQPLTAVRAVLNSYAQRGVFRSLDEHETAAEVRFKFHWLWNAPFQLTFEKRSGSLVFKSLLPKTDPDLEASVQSFLEECRSTERLAHRRINLPFTFRKGTLRMKVADGNYDSGTRQAIQFVNELFTSHMNLHHADYLAEHYRVPED